MDKQELREATMETLVRQTAHWFGVDMLELTKAIIKLQKKRKVFDCKKCGGLSIKKRCAICKPPKGAVLSTK